MESCLGGQPRKCEMCLPDTALREALRLRVWSEQLWFEALILTARPAPFVGPVQNEMRGRLFRSY